MRLIDWRLRWRLSTRTCLTRLTTWSLSTPKIKIAPQNSRLYRTSWNICSRPKDLMSSCSRMTACQRSEIDLPTSRNLELTWKTHLKTDLFSLKNPENSHWISRTHIIFCIFAYTHSHNRKLSNYTPAHGFSNRRQNTISIHFTWPFYPLI